jgi:uncharacterized protein YajQ (UPF0234 family)
MPSFDVVSRLDFQEIDNAIKNCLREIGTRYDFKGSNTTIERSEKQLTVITDDDFKLKQFNDLIITHLVRRKVDILCLKESTQEKASGNKIRQVYKLVEGIEQPISKKITNDIKSLKLKVQVKINGNELRVAGKKKDDLQTSIQMIKDAKLGIPIQFVNYRD